MSSAPWQKPVRGMQINKAHPLARGLVGAWVMNEGTGDKVFDLSGNGGDALVSVFDWKGDELYKIGANDQVVLLPSDYKPIDGSSAFSIVTKMRIEVSTTDNGIFYTDEHKSGEPILLWFDNATTDHFVTIITTSAGTTGGLYSGFVPLPNVNYTLILTWDGATVRLYINGIEDTNGDFPASIGGTLLTSIGNYAWGNSYELDKDLQGGIKYGYIYDRALFPEEVAYLHREPYAMFEQPISPASLYYEAPVGVTIPVLMHHYNQMMRA